MTNGGLSMSQVVGVARLRKWEMRAAIGFCQFQQPEIPPARKRLTPGIVSRSLKLVSSGVMMDDWLRR